MFENMRMTQNIPKKSVRFLHPPPTPQKITFSRHEVNIDIEDVVLLLTSFPCYW